MPCIGLCMWIAGYLPVKRGDKASGQRCVCDAGRARQRACALRVCSGTPSAALTALWAGDPSRAPADAPEPAAPSGACTHPRAACAPRLPPHAPARRLRTPAAPSRTRHRRCAPSLPPAPCSFLDRCAELLRNNVWVLIFAEGTRKIDGCTGPIGPFKAGAFKLALDEDVPVVPITISGARHIMPVRGFPYLAYGRCKLIIHPPVASKGKTVEALMGECRSIIATRLEACDELEPLEPAKSKVA